MKKSKFKVSIILVLIVSFSLLVGCSNIRLSEDFDEDQVKEEAMEIIEIVNNKDTEALLDKSNVQMKRALDEDTVDEMYEAIDEGGGFKEIREIEIGGNKDKETEEEYGVAVIKAEYENKNFIYTILFTKQMKLAGLTYK